VIPLNDDVLVYKNEKKDSWGIVVTSTEPIEYKCMTTYATDIQELKNAEGEQIVITATIVLKGTAAIDVEDQVSIDGGITQQEVLKVSPIKDLSAKTVFTKVVI